MPTSCRADCKVTLARNRATTRSLWPKRGTLPIFSPSNVRLSPLQLLDLLQQLGRLRRLLLREQHDLPQLGHLRLAGAGRLSHRPYHHAVQVRHVDLLGVLSRHTTQRDGAATVDDVTNEIANPIGLNHEPE